MIRHRLTVMHGEPETVRELFYVAAPGEIPQPIIEVQHVYAVTKKPEQLILGFVLSDNNEFTSQINICLWIGTSLFN